MNNLAKLIIRLEELSKRPILYKRYDPEPTLRYAKYEIYSGSIPKEVLIRSLRICKEHLEVIQGFSGDYSELFYLYRYIPSFEYDEEIGGPFLVQVKHRIEVPQGQKTSVQEEIMNEVNACIEFIESANLFLSQENTSPQLANKASEKIKMHPTFEYIYYKSLPTNVETLYNDLKGEFISTGTPYDHFSIIFSGKQTDMPPVEWIGSSWRLARDMITWLMEAKVLIEKRKSEVWSIGHSCFIYPAKPTAKLNRQQPTSGPDFLKLRAIIQKFILATPKVRNNKL